MSLTTRDNLRTAIRLMDTRDRGGLLAFWLEMKTIGDQGAVNMCNAILARWDEVCPPPRKNR